MISSSPTISTSTGGRAGPTGCSQPLTILPSPRPLMSLVFDIYHPTQDELTGKEIAFGGDLALLVKGGANYLVWRPRRRASWVGCHIRASSGCRR